MNQARLKVLQSREQFIEELINETRKRLFVASNDANKYRETLKGLITQVAFCVCVLICFWQTLVLNYSCLVFW